MKASKQTKNGRQRFFRHDMRSFDLEVCILAIDPGASGGIAWHQTTGEAGAFRMPDTDREIADVLTPFCVIDGVRFEASERAKSARVAYLEDLVKYTGRNMPSSSMATYAGNWGFIKGVLTAHCYRIVIVPPKKWQTALGLGTSKGMGKTEWKNKLKNRAEQLYPGIKVTLATADALLILEAAKRGILG